MLQNPLLKLLLKDQESIRLYTNKSIDFAEFEKRNKEITEEFKNYINIEGFPFKNKETYEVYKAGVALSLHSDIDFLKFIKNIFEKVGPSEIDPEHLAYLVDKIEIFEGRRQIYGTQFKRLLDGSIEFLEIENLAGVDERRKKINLSTLEEYKKFAETDRK